MSRDARRGVWVLWCVLALVVAPSAAMATLAPDRLWISADSDGRDLDDALRALTGPFLVPPAGGAQHPPGPARETLSELHRPLAPGPISRPTPSRGPPLS